MDFEQIWTVYFNNSCNVIRSNLITIIINGVGYINNMCNIAFSDETMFVINNFSFQRHRRISIPTYGHYKERTR